MAFLLIVFLGLISCSKEQEKLQTDVERTVLIYMLANNSLSGFDNNNIESIIQSATAKNLNGGNLLLYWVPRGSNPQLLQIKENANGVVTKNLIRDYDISNSATPTAVQTIIKDVVSEFPAKEYGLVLWSHGTAWIPADYANMLKSFGQDGSNWMEIDELAKGIPNNLFHFIMFDACYMASIECAYELKDKAEYILASPTETMATGWPYQSIMPYFFTQTAQLEKIADIFFNYYEAQNGDNQTATVSVVKTSELDNMAIIMKEILANKSESDIFALDRTKMQKLEFLGKGSYTVSPCLLFDFDDFVKQLATDEQYARFTASMAKLITYEAHTKTAYFAGLRSSYPIDKCSGLTVYAPQERLSKLNDWYWNQGRLQWTMNVYNK